VHEPFHATLERWLLSKGTFQTFEEAQAAVVEFMELQQPTDAPQLGQESPAAFMK
jgi:hypothetical protein